MGKMDKLGKGTINGMYSGNIGASDKEMSFEKL